MPKKKVTFDAAASAASPKATGKRKRGSSRDGTRAPKKYQKKKCSVESCPNRVNRGGVCVGHGAEKKRCSVESCNKQAQKGGVCFRHGAKAKECSVESCNNQVQKGGVCFLHGAEAKICSVESCNKQVQKGGVCWIHGGKSKECSISNCGNYSSREGKCPKHCENILFCTSKGCKKIALARGLCSRHGKESWGGAIDLNVAVPALPSVEMFDCVYCYETFDVSNLNTCAADNACACVICYTCLRKKFCLQRQRINGQVIHHNPTKCPCCRTDGAFTLDGEEQFAAESSTYEYDDSSFDANFYASSSESYDEYEERSVGSRSYYSEGGTSVGGETNYSTSHEDGDPEWSEGDE